jgi:hypothetical protein
MSAMVAVLSGGQQVRKDVDRLRTEFVRSPKKLTRRASAKLGLPGTFWMVFRKRVRLKACKVQSLQKQSCPATHHEGARGERQYSSYLFLTSALDGGVSGQRHAPTTLCPGERTPGTHCTGGWSCLRAVWTQRLQEKSAVSAGDRTQIARSFSP